MYRKLSRPIKGWTDNNDRIEISGKNSKRPISSNEGVTVYEEEDLQIISAVYVLQNQMKTLLMCDIYFTTFARDNIILLQIKSKWM